MIEIAGNDARTSVGARQVFDQCGCKGTVTLLTLANPRATDRAAIMRP
jgi:hypothetical protein